MTPFRSMLTPYFPPVNSCSLKSDGSVKKRAA